MFYFVQLVYIIKDTRVLTFEKIHAPARCPGYELLHTALKMYTPECGKHPSNMHCIVVFVVFFCFFYHYFQTSLLQFFFFFFFSLLSTNSINYYNIDIALLRLSSLRKCSKTTTSFSLCSRGYLLSSRDVSFQILDFRLFPLCHL